MLMHKGAELASATVPWHWLFFVLPRSYAMKTCLEIMIPKNIFPKSFEASKWGWLILAPNGVLADSIPSHSPKGLPLRFPLRATGNLLEIGPLVFIYLTN